MAEPFKNFMSPELIGLIALHLKRQVDGFDIEAFTWPLLEALPSLELMQRMQMIADAIHMVLPDDPVHRTQILLAMLHPDPLNHADKPSDEQGVCGWGVWPLTLVVGKYGLAAFDGSLGLLKEMTKRGTAEFGVRPFLQADLSRALEIITPWTQDENMHVRRLASEGTRPRLPWAMQLKKLIADPGPTLPILLALRDDGEEYVRRSVANHLNDIAKDHPDRVARIANDWMTGAPKPRQKLVRHACRTLVKQGHPMVLDAFGIGAPAIDEPVVNISTPDVALGSVLSFSVLVHSTSSTAQKLIIDYVVNFRKANGTLAPKVFKWTQLNLAPGERIVLQRHHAIRPITTRKYYAGTHALSVQINGTKFGSENFTLHI